MSKPRELSAVGVLALANPPERAAVKAASENPGPVFAVPFVALFPPLFFLKNK